MNNETYYYESCIHALMQKGYDYETAKSIVEYSPLTTKFREGNDIEYFQNTDVDDWVEIMLRRGEYVSR